MSVNLTDTDDSAPLHVSAECGHLEVTKVFVLRGAAINYIDKYCDTPFMVAAKMANLISYVTSQKKAWILIFITLKTTLFFTWFQLWILCIV